MAVEGLEEITCLTISSRSLIVTKGEPIVAATTITEKEPGSKTQGRHTETDDLRLGQENWKGIIGVFSSIAGEGHCRRRRRAVGADGRGRGAGVAVSSQSGEEKEEVWPAAVGEREDAENGCEGCAGGRREKREQRRDDCWWQQLQLLAGEEETIKKRGLRRGWRRSWRGKGTTGESN
ncbi:hypothetical protein OIU84_027385 [Salix udensis]|uniref:Uncharacterized protein n=1 Tax=Salix udensis TaxID=889485 RepID=A0AAD6PAC2_9ROSI|nr:hypothetical protein OIU84_027385 [Salix udensis]